MSPHLLYLLVFPCAVVYTDMARLLDDKLLTFNEAYQVSLLHPSQASMLLRHLEEHPEQRVDMDKLKEFRTKKAQVKTSERSIVFPIIVEDMLVPRQMDAIGE